MIIMVKYDVQQMEQQNMDTEQGSVDQQGQPVYSDKTVQSVDPENVPYYNYNEQQLEDMDKEYTMTPRPLQRAKEAVKGKFMEAKQNLEKRRQQKKEAQYEAQQYYDEQRLQALKDREMKKVNRRIEWEKMTPRERIQSFKQGAQKVIGAGQGVSNKLGRLGDRMATNLGIEGDPFGDLKKGNKKSTRKSRNTTNTAGMPGMSTISDSGFGSPDKIQDIVGGDNFINGMSAVKGTKRSSKKKSASKKKKSTGNRKRTTTPQRRGGGVPDKDRIKDFLWG